MSTRKLIAAGATLALVLAACGDDDDGAAGPTTTAPATTSAPTTTTVPAAPTDVRVYFTNADALLAVAGRTVTDTDVVRAALVELLAGPGGIEAEVGYASAIPAGTELRGVSVDGSVALVDLSAEFGAGGGSASILGRAAQVVYTLTQFPEVERVRFAIEGEPVETLGGEGLVVDGDGVDRSAFDAVLPMILVESPTPGAEVTSPVTLSGLNNTFENTVNYTLTDPEGLILEEGFTTGTGDIGAWGAFETTIELTTDRGGLGALIVYEISPRDGSRQHVVEVPIRM